MSSRQQREVVIMRLNVEDLRTNPNDSEEIIIHIYHDFIHFQSARNGIPKHVKFERRGSTLKCQIVDSGRNLRHTRRFNFRLSFVRIEGQNVIVSSFDPRIFESSVVLHMREASAILKFPQLTDVNLYLFDGAIIDAHGSPRTIDLKKAVGERNFIRATNLSYSNEHLFGILKSDRVNEGQCATRINGFLGVPDAFDVPVSCEITLYPWLPAIVIAANDDGDVGMYIQHQMNEQYPTTRRDSLPENERPKIITRKKFILENKSHRAALTRAAEDAKKEGLCNYCYDEKIQCAVFPCFHATSCEKCTKKIISGIRATEDCGLSEPTCPCCRTKINFCIKF